MDETDKERFAGEFLKISFFLLFIILYLKKKEKPLKSDSYL